MVAGVREYLEAIVVDMCADITPEVFRALNCCFTGVGPESDQSPGNPHPGEFFPSELLPSDSVPSELSVSERHVHVRSGPVFPGKVATDTMPSMPCRGALYGTGSLETSPTPTINPTLRGTGSLETSPTPTINPTLCTPNTSVVTSVTTGPPLALARPTPTPVFLHTNHPMLAFATPSRPQSPPSELFSPHTPGFILPLSPPNSPLEPKGSIPNSPLELEVNMGQYPGTQTPRAGSLSSPRPDRRLIERSEHGKGNRGGLQTGVRTILRSVPETVLSPVPLVLDGVGAGAEKVVDEHSNFYPPSPAFFPLALEILSPRKNVLIQAGNKVLYMITEV